MKPYDRDSLENGQSCVGMLAALKECCASNHFLSTCFFDLFFVFVYGNELSYDYSAEYCQELLP